MSTLEYFHPFFVVYIFIFCILFIQGNGPGVACLVYIKVLFFKGLAILCHYLYILSYFWGIATIVKSSPLELPILDHRGCQKLSNDWEYSSLGLRKTDVL